MGLSELIDGLGDRPALAVGGLLVGLLFGAAAQRSKFCLRSAAIELTERSLGPRIAIWTLAFAAAVAGTQAAIALGWLDVSGARQLSDRGSLSGAIIGGLMFGTGMILARGCASRLLVLSATGNLRALLAGLVLTIVAQASLRGVLAGPREALAVMWTLDGGQARQVLAWLGGGPWTGVLLGLCWIAIGGWIARRSRIGADEAISAVTVGVTVALGWSFTYAMSQASFEPVRVTSVTFTGPAADTLMGLINARSLPMSFDTGLVPGVFLGSMAAALASGEFKLQGFEGGHSMLRYLVGAPLMGFGGMLAGGCAVGAGLSGGAIFALTGWVALASMWVAAMATHIWLDAKSGRLAQS